MKFSKLTLSALTLCATVLPASVFAGKFEVWTDSTSGDVQTAIVSFAGDGSTQEAQADYAVSKGWQVVQSKALVAGSVCASVAGGTIARAVPPSGAGNALSGSTIDYCSFQFKRAAAGSEFGLTLKLSECATTSSIAKCGSSVRNLAK